MSDAHSRRLAKRISRLLDKAKYRTEMSARTGKLATSTTIHPDPKDGAETNKIWVRIGATKLNPAGRRQTQAWNYGKVSTRKADLAVIIDFNGQGELYVVRADEQPANASGVPAGFYAADALPPELSDTVIPVANLLDLKPYKSDGLILRAKPGILPNGTRWSDTGGHDMTSNVTTTAGMTSYVIVGIDLTTNQWVAETAVDHALLLPWPSHVTDVETILQSVPWASVFPIAAVPLANGASSYNKSDIVDLRSLGGRPSTSGGAGIVETVDSGPGISIDSTDPANPVVSLDDATTSAIGGVQIDQSPASGAPVALTAPRLGAERGIAPLDGATQVASAHLPTPFGTLDEAARWVKSAGNPILSPAVAWEATAVQEPCVIDPEDGLIKMWYRGGWLTEAIGYATCPITSDPRDPANWTKYASNPILGQGGSGISGNAAQPRVVHYGDTYYLYYTEFLGSGDMRLALSSNGITGWTVQAGVVATKPSGSSSWGNRSVVRRPDGVWYMLGEANNGSGVWQIYLLTSADGITFTYLNSGNPLTSLQIASGGMYGGPTLIAPSTIDGYWHVYYHAAANSGVLPTRIYHAKSLNLINWTVVTSPALNFEGTGFEIDQVADPHVIELFGTVYLFYDGDDNGASAAHIGVASVACTLHELVSGAGASVREDIDGLVPVTKLPLATTGAAGIVKPDGSTITIDVDGTIHASEAAIYAPISSGDLADPLILDSDGRVIVGRIA